MNIMDFCHYKNNMHFWDIHRSIKFIVAFQECSNQSYFTLPILPNERDERDEQIISVLYKFRCMYCFLHIRCNVNSNSILSGKMNKRCLRENIIYALNLLRFKFQQYFHVSETVCKKTLFLYSQPRCLYHASTIFLI